ncbi:hypothetical protein SDC9_112851 [bioreactor metagenome]|uniref:Uncharacterized protein n=1 Tax=bioreactor metagenome TaxID=1076179 RepID=A0A645BKW8_9ZZZZ
MILYVINMIGLQQTEHVVQMQNIIELISVTLSILTSINEPQHAIGKTRL